MEADGAALVSASVTNDVIEEMFGAKLDNPDVDTIGGYVYMTWAECLTWATSLKPTP